MSRTTEKHTERRLLIELIEEGFQFGQALRAIDERLHGDGPLSEAERAILFLLSARALTAPEAARQRQVSRQRSQQILNALTQARLVARARNPVSEKSPLYQLTAEGRKAVGAMYRKEHRLYARALPLVGERKLKAALDTLRILRTEFNR